MDPTILKRRRPDESRDGDLYFEDGSVIICVNEADGDLVYFRVHKSVLSKQSTVFKDMFSLPTPPVSEVETYDGLPLVHVHDDAKEFKKFLLAIYDPSFLPFLRLDLNTPELVLGPLKLAKKYQADVLRDRITTHLAADCPTTLEDWDEVAYPAKSESTPSSASEASSPSGDDPPDYLTKDFLPDPIPFLTLARECSLLVTFATLLYSLCRDSATRKEKLSRMARGDLETLFLGRDRMTRFVRESGALELEIESWIPEYDYGYSGHGLNCTDPECHTLLFKDWSKILEDVMFYGDPLATFRMTSLKYRKFADEDHLWDEDHYNRRKDEICFWCKDRLANKLDDLRQHLFDELPSFFPLNDDNSQMAESED